MPQNPIMVYAKEDGTATYMHTVDAAEAVRLGDYTPMPPDKDGPSPEERASALSRFRTGQGVTHPELQTDEEREQTREEANAKAEMMAGVPEGAQVVVMAQPERAATSRQASSTRRHEEESARARGGSAPPSSGAPSGGSTPSSSSTTSSAPPTARKD
jgi:hypothetical protein